MAAEPYPDSNGANWYKCFDCGWSVERVEIVMVVDERGIRTQVCIECLGKIAKVITDHRRRATA
jgi:hypothetical protein